MGSPSDSHHDLPESIGSYQVLDEIGQGGMGIIYRAQDQSLDRVVALKVLREDFRAQKELVARFRREAQAAARLNHPNIVQIFTVGEDENIPFIAMEYIDGAPLSAILQLEGPLPWRRALEIAEQVAEALACAHAAQVIHRDIKPQNILINSADQAFVTDFGIAKILTVEEQLTVDGTSLGTPQFMAPERCKSGEVTAASDIYSLGVLLFQMLTGRLPFEASSSVELVRKILSEPPTRLRAFNPHIPESVERLVAYLIEKKPADRPATAEKVCEAIARVRDDRPLDEEQLSVSSALDDFRRTGPPKLTDFYNEATTKLLLVQKPIAAFTLRWFGTPHPWKVAIAGVFVLIAGLFLGGIVADALRDDPAVIQARQLELDAGRWFHDGTVAIYDEASPEILTAKIALSSMAVSRAMWCYDYAYIQLDGVPQTPRDGQRLITSFHPESKSAWVSVPPAHVLAQKGEKAPLNLLAGARLSVPGTYLASHALVQFHSEFAETSSPRQAAFYAFSPIATDQPPTGFFPFTGNGSPRGDTGHDVSAIAIGPNGRQFAVAYASPEGVAVAEIARLPEGGWSYQAISPPGPPVTAIEYDATGMSLAILRESGEQNRQIWLASLLEGAEILLAEGPFTMAPGALHPEGDAVVVGVERIMSDGDIRIYHRTTPDEPVHIGSGVMPSWHPSGSSVIALGRDMRQRLQVFAFESAPPFRQRQLSHHENGMKPYCAVSGNGQWALAPLVNHEADAPHIAFVSLGRATW